MYVYVITNTTDGKVYVGKSVAPAKRWQQHQTVARDGKKGRLYDAIREDGAASFEFMIVEECASEEASFDAERAWIARLCATDPRRGYNMTLGGNGPPALSDHRYRHVTPAMCWALYSKGMAGPEIARQLGVASCQPIYRLLKLGGYPLRNAGRVAKPEVTVAQCWALYSQGLSLKAVGDGLGCSAHHVHRLLKGAGYKLRDARESHAPHLRLVSKP